MLSKCVLALCVLPAPAVATAATPPPALAVQEWARLSPFTGVRVAEDRAEVELDGRWHELVSIEGLTTAEILAWCRRSYGDRAEKRFAEDLVEVLAGLGIRGKTAVDLVLREQPGGARVEKKAVAMTAENRARVRRSREASHAPDAVEPRRDWARRAAFTDVVVDGGRVEVELDGARWELVSIEGRATAQVLEHARRAFGAAWEKRFVEDLVEVLAGLGVADARAVDLELAAVPGGEPVVREGVPLNAEKRGELMRRRKARELDAERGGAVSGGGGRSTGAGGEASGAGAVRRIERAHAAEVAPAYAALARVRAALPGEPTLPRDEAAADLDELEARFVHEFSYRDLAGVDLRVAFDAVRAALPERVGRGALAEALQRLIARFGDGHAGVVGPAAELDSSRSVDCLYEAAGGAVLALRPDRSGFLDPARPRLVALDGVPLERWIDAAAAFGARGSPQLVRARALRRLRSVELVRRELGLPASDVLALELARLDGSDRTTRTLPLERAWPAYGEWPRTETRELEGGVGYLRIARMDDAPAFLDGLDRAIEGFRSTRALVVDVRGNGGGSRLALLRLAPYFLEAGDPPRVASVAAPRLAGGDVGPEGALADRYAWPLSASRWDAAERAAIRAAESAFRPAWTPPAGEFGPWHWLVLARRENPRAFRYEGPVVVLMDGGCFSATDVFLGGLKGTRGVTLLGTPSGGGSGRAVARALAHSGLVVRLSTMASFRPDGSLYDGAGVAPDVEVEPLPEWFVGGRDAQLEAALARLR